MTSRRPRTPKEFLEHASRLAGAGKERELLAFADEYGQQFQAGFNPEERARLEGIFESAQAIVDLQEWTAARERSNGRAAAQGAAEPVTSVSGH